jgi:hypothetical protein
MTGIQEVSPKPAMEESIGAGQIKLMPKTSTVILRRPDRAGLVFGLEWTPLVGAGSAKRGRRHARSLRATHYLVIGSPFAVVGCAVVPRTEASTHSFTFSRKVIHYSAAALFALAHSDGVVAAIFHLKHRGYWFVAVQAGLVLSQTDRWYTHLTDAHAALDSMKSRFPNLRSLVLQDLHETTLTDWLVTPEDEICRLKKISGAGPVAAKIILACMLAVTFWMWDKNSTMPVAPEVVPDEAAQWKVIFDRFVSMHPVHHSDHLLKVLDSWRHTPIHPGGWVLKRITCESIGHDWQCAARYRPRERFALSVQLDNLKPNGWRAEYVDLDQAALRWEIVDAAAKFELISKAIPLKEWMSYLQGIRPLFDSIQIGTGTKIHFPAPLDANGVAIQSPSHLKPFMRRSLVIQGPLRSVSALRGLPVPVRWRSLQLDVGVLGGSGVTRSELMVHLIGELFEIAE